MVRRRCFSVKNAEILRALRHLNQSQRAALLRKADSNLIRCICECTLNVINGNVPLTKLQKTRLKKHAKNLRKIASPKGTWCSKRKIIAQQSTFLTLLLSALDSIIDSVISSSQ